MGSKKEGLASLQLSRPRKKKERRMMGLRPGYLPPVSSLDREAKNEKKLSKTNALSKQAKGRVPVDKIEKTVKNKEERNRQARVKGLCNLT